MKIFNTKHLAVALSIATCIPASPVHAGWGEQLMQRATDFLQNKVKPALQKPEAYIAGAALLVAGLATYYCRNDIYWAFKNELPLDRAQNRVRSHLRLFVKDRDAVSGMYNAVIADDLFTQCPADALIQKDAIDACVHRHMTRYEFSEQRTHDWECDGVQIVKHAVCPQTGTNCGYHALWNGVKMYALLSNSTNSDTLYEALQIGPPIQDWKNNIHDFEQIRWQFQLQSNPNAKEIDAKHSNSCYENISDSAIEHLLDTHFNLDMPKNDITIVSNLSQYGPIIDENLPELVNALRTGEKRRHVFVVGNMVSADMAGPSGHWVALVIERMEDAGGQVVFRMHTADSLGSDCWWYVRRLVQILKNASSI